MAERRMFAKTIIDSDAFLDMPMSSQNLYFHLSMRADDDGFINNPKKVQRMLGASDDDLKILIAKSFIITFDSGIIVIKHWRISNYLRSDRYKPTVYNDEKLQLEIKDNGAYHKVGIPCVNQPVYQVVDERETQYSIGKDSIGKDRVESVAKAPRIPSERFIKPTVEELKAYCDERKNSIDPHRFFDHYESTGWKVGKNPMKNWQAAIRTWEKNSFDKPAAPAPVKAKEPRCACGGTINPAGLCRLCMKEFYTYGDDDE